MPTRTDDALWTLAAEKRGAVISKGVRRFLILQWRDVIERVVGAGTAEQVEELAQRLAVVAGNLEAAGLSDEVHGGESLSIADPGAEKTNVSDERWALWRELRRASGASQGDAEPWSAFRMTRVIDLSDARLLSDRVDLSFDNRLSLARLKAELDRVWPELLREGWVRQSRPLQRRVAALVRFVCLESAPGLTWHERWGAWNAACESRTSLDKRWRYRDHRAMHSDFRRTEVSLTGRARGLAWFYDARLRANEAALDALSTRELAARAVRGDSAARDYLEHSRRPHVEHMKPVLAGILMEALALMARRVQSGVVSVEEFRDLGAEWVYELVKDLDADALVKDEIGPLHLETGRVLDTGANVQQAIDTLADMLTDITDGFGLLDRGDGVEGESR